MLRLRLGPSQELNECQAGTYVKRKTAGAKSAEGGNKNPFTALNGLKKTS